MLHGQDMINEKIYIISDAHMGAQSAGVEEKKLELMISFLNSLREQPCRLVICGDLFDFWFEYRHAVPRRHFQLLAQLNRLVHSGIDIDYLAGNHDFWLGSFMEQQVGMHLHPEDLELMQSGKKIYFRHGDGLLKKDSGYRALKKVLRHPVCIFLYRLVHPDVGVPLALYFSQLSRNADKPACFKTDAEYRAYAFQKIEQGYDIVVLGHSHAPACIAHGQGWYVNAGNWIDSFTFAVLEAGRPALYRWNGQAVKIPSGL
jgi:UDP-2,3-diacylglucosamine hydrolase